MRNTEPRINAALAEALDGRHPRWRVRAERTGVFADEPSLQPDVLVELSGTAPVVIEAEFAPAVGAEAEAFSRLGKVVKGIGLPVEQAVALRYGADLRTCDGLRAGIESASLEWCVLSGDAKGLARWPEAGWLRGGVDELAAVVEQLSISERLVARGLEVLERGVRVAANVLRSDALPGFGGGLEKMAAMLHQEEGEQTSRMAMAIVANAMTYHLVLAGRGAAPHFEEIKSELGGVSVPRLLQSWREILQINYWPIFKIALDLMATVRASAAFRIVDRLADVAQELSRIGATSLGDLSGRMFQRLIADRKFLATFYTLPNSSTLLAELAIPELGVDWSDGAEVEALRIGDLACGTGALLLAAYQGVLSRHRRTGGDDALLHAGMMENAMIAADIMPAATHLTASNLSMAHPDVVFEDTRVYTMPYGMPSEGEHHAASIGSLDLLDETHDANALLFGTGQRQARGDQADRRDAHVDVPHGSLDLAIMNPPFTRPTNHEKADVPVPSFAGFGNTRDEQRAMSTRLRSIRARTKARTGHGNAGLASNFLQLAHAKTRPGGAIALVLPAAFAQGGSWRAAREMVEAEYENVVVVSLAATGQTDRAFSADTGMGEVLLVGRKRAAPGVKGPALFANLLRRPGSPVEAVEAARSIRARLDPDAPASGWLSAGEVHLGSYVKDSLTDSGAAGVANPRLAATMRELIGGSFRPPRQAKAVSIPMTALGELGKRGPVHRDINGVQPDGAPRGPFDIAGLDAAEQPPTYPVLWGHDASSERCLVVRPDRAGRVRDGCEDRAVAIWEAAAGRLHLNLGFQLSSQSLAACFTPEAAIGGQAWPSFQMASPDWDYPVLLWANTTLGLMSFWWRGSRQQRGRAILTISRLPELPALDPRRLSPEQINRAKEIFEEFKDRPMLPANEAYRDEVRAELDRAVLVRLLELPERVQTSLALLRTQWCAEPSVHGGKPTRPTEDR